MFHSRGGVRPERKKNVPSFFRMMPPPHPLMMQCWSAAAPLWDRFLRAKKTFHSRFRRTHQSSQHCKGRGGRQWSGEVFEKSEGTFFSLGTGRDCRKTIGVYASDRNIPVLKRPCPFAASHPRAMQKSVHVSRCTDAMSSRKGTSPRILSSMATGRAFVLVPSGDALVGYVEQRLQHQVGPTGSSL